VNIVIIADVSLSDVDVLVIGAGPTGLGAAKRLQQLVCSNVDISLPFLITDICDLRTTHHGSLLIPMKYLAALHPPRSLPKAL
jgi:malic enzyme